MLLTANSRARQALANAERNPATTPETLDALRQRVQTTQQAYTQAQGPPPKPTNVFGGPTVGGDIGQAHQAALEAHQQAVDTRIHEEGETPVPSPGDAGKIFRLGGETRPVVRGVDPQGNEWVGTGNAMVRNGSLDKAAIAASKLKTAPPPLTPASAALGKVTTPQAGTDYQPVTFGRRITADGMDQVVGTRADGSHLSVQKPVYDALHAAAGPDGTIVAGPAEKTAGKRVATGDGRLFARNAQGETMGVGMPVRVDQARAKVWMHGAEAPAPITPGTLADRSARIFPQKGLEEQTGVTSELTPSVPGPDLLDPAAAHNQEVGPGTTPEAPEVQPPGAETPPTEAEPAPEPGSQLARLMATREELAGTPTLSDRDNIKLQSVEKQIRRLQAAQRKGAPPPTTAPVAKELTPPGLGLEHRGGYVPKDFAYYKFNNGTSVYTSVFEATGHDPKLAVNRPLAWQNKVLGEHLKNQFGFRDVSIAPGTNPMFARDTMLDLTRAAQDMANSLGMRPSLISLDGRLAFQLEPKGKRDYLGAYDGGTKTIHLVNDANSFGHEWIHAVDHLLTEQLLNNPQMQNLLSRHARAGALDTSDGAQAAFAKLLNTMFFDEGALALHRINLEELATRVDRSGAPTKGAIEAKRQLDALDKGASQQRIQPSKFRQMSAQFGKPSYWASAHEMLARVGEAWLARQMENNGVDPRGVVMPSEAYLKTTDDRLRMTFPKDEEHASIMLAMSDLFDRLKNDGVITGPTAPKADFPAATIGWSRQTPRSVQRTPFGQAVRRELNGLSAGLKKLTPRNFINELRGGTMRPAAPEGLSAKTRLADEARAFLYSYGGRMRVLIARNKGPGGNALQAIYDRLSPDPGSGRAVGETFNEDHRATDNIWRSRFADIFKEYGITDPNDMSALEAHMIQHVMTTGRDTYPHDPLDLRPNAPADQVPKHLQNIAGDLQAKILMPIYRELTNAGFEVGVAPNGYFPRIYDERAVFSNPTGFHAAALKMHQVMFDQDVGEPGENPTRLLERWMQLNRVDRAAADPALPPAMKALRANLRRQAELETIGVANLSAAEQAELQALKDEARQLAEDNHEAVRDHVADLAASDWENRIIKGDPLEFETMGPSGRFLNRRTLPPEADQIMREFMHTDPRVAIPRYIDSGMRRLAWAKAFGKNSEFLDKQIQLAKDGGVSGPDLQDFQSLVNQSTGRMTYKSDRHIQKVSQQANALGAVLMMSRSAWSSLAEPMNAAMATGELGAAWHTFANQFGAIFHTASSYERTEIADMLGVTTGSAYDTIMQSRTGADYSDSPATDRVMSMFYRASFLTQLTTSQRRAAVGTADWLLRKWAKDLRSTDKGAAADARRDDAQRMFSELGITTQGNNLRDQFANWMLSYDGPVPSTELIHSEFRGVYGLAMRRLVDRMIQNPYKIDRPAISGVPMLNLAVQLMSFNYTYQKNILEPFFHRMGHAWTRGYQRSYEQAKGAGAGDFGAKARGYAGGARGFSRTFARSAIIAAATIFAGLISSLPRQALFSPDQWKQHVKDDDLGTWLLGLAISRSGIGGTLDPIGQVYNNLRWDSDLSKLFNGATPGLVLQNLQNLIQPLISNAQSPNTNTQYYNQARAFYNLLFVPAEVLSLTLMNAAGGPVGKAITGSAMQYFTSPAAANWFAKTLTGPQGSTLSEAADDEGLSADAGADLPSTDELEEPDGKPSQPGGRPPGDTGLIPLSMWDDIAIPLFRALEKPWMLMPGYAKAGAAAVAAALYAIHWANETKPWRDNPEPPEQP